MSFRPPSSHKSFGWLSQYVRTRRWYEKLKELQMDASEEGALSYDTEDYLYTFFQNCFHLREWIENDGAVPKSELESFVSSHIELGLCRDICNGTKHMNITRPSVDKDFDTFKEFDYLASPCGETFRIQAAGKKYDLFELADDCMKLWIGFLKERGLLTQHNGPLSID